MKRKRTGNDTDPRLITAARMIADGEPERKVAVQWLVEHMRGRVAESR